MVPVAELKDLKIFEAIASPTLNALSEDIVERSFGPGDFILHQHDEARAIYILLAGSVEFLMMIEGMEDLYVGETSEPGALIGWSVVREPFRFTASARCTEPSRVLKVPRDSLHRILKDDPTTGELCRNLGDATRSSGAVFSVVGGDTVGECDAFDNHWQLVGAL